MIELCRNNLLIVDLKQNSISKLDIYGHEVFSDAQILPLSSFILYPSTLDNIDTIIVINTSHIVSYSTTYSNFYITSVIPVNSFSV